MPRREGSGSDPPGSDRRRSAESGAAGGTVEGQYSGRGGGARRLGEGGGVPLGGEAQRTPGHVPSRIGRAALAGCALQAHTNYATRWRGRTARSELKARSPPLEAAATFSPATTRNDSFSRGTVRCGARRKSPRTQWPNRHFGRPAARLCGRCIARGAASPAHKGVCADHVERGRGYPRPRRRAPPEPAQGVCYGRGGTGARPHVKRVHRGNHTLYPASERERRGRG